MSSTFIDLPVSIPMGAISLAGASISGISSALTKKYQKKLAKFTKLTGIVTSVLTVFETSVSKALKDGKIDEWEFNMLQVLYYQSFNNLSNVDHKMEAENRNQFEKSLREEINDIKKELTKRCVMTCTLFPLCYFVCCQN